jgi:hypothetical protein
MVEHFHRVFPEIAAEESRLLAIEADGKPGAVPKGEYYFLESYCTNPDCDCERVLIDVVEKQRGVLAGISYYFNPPSSSSPAHADDPNPSLEPSHRQSVYAEAALAMFVDAIRDKEYTDRLRRHYRMVKSAGRFFLDSAGRNEAGERNRRGDWAKQKRKQEKAARRRGRRA